MKRKPQKALKAPNVSISDYDIKPMTTEAAFKKGADLAEGIAGRVEISTRYEQGEADCSHPEQHY
jgi:hypothetical protein